MTSSVADSITSVVAVPVGSTHAPPMRKRSRTIGGVAVWVAMSASSQWMAAPAGASSRTPAIASAVRWASAMIETIGFVPDAVGNALPSPIHTPGVSCSSPHGPATDVAGSVPMRQLPI